MSKLRMVFIILLVILGVMVVFTVLSPMATGQKYSKVQSTQLLQAEDEWVIQFDIMNNEEKDTSYEIEVLHDNELYRAPVVIPDEGMFTYIHRIPYNTKGNRDITFTIYKDGDSEPLRQLNYYLK